MRSDDVDVIGKSLQPRMVRIDGAAGEARIRRRSSLSNLYRTQQNKKRKDYESFHWTERLTYGVLLLRPLDSIIHERLG